MYRLNSLNADIQLIVDGAWANEHSASESVVYNYLIILSIVYHGHLGLWGRHGGC